MSEPDDIILHFLQPLIALDRLLSRCGDRGVLIGGIAASLMGKPRLTADLDALFLVPIEQIHDLIEIASQEGMSPRIKEAEDFARQHRVLLLRHSASGINIDISLGILPFEEEVVDRSILHRTDPIPLRLPTPEDLIILKAVAHRSKDLLDIQGIIENYPDLDRRRIEYWVRQFAEALEMPELWDDIAGCAAI
ncbi:MAG: nucleotidyl transferase AbiEii/AbiGii toxin family protein [Armatimonadetes bacterium]|nr:nucleotidyl transferase AbiEii/AbiGii toxin family protein [Armatimonadota bacterium]